MDLALQAKLLRVIQEKEVERIGGRDVIPLNVRVLATTNRDLRAFVADGRFREDLYYRLNVFPLHIPPLRDRPLDILPLTEMALARYATGSSTPITLAACARDKMQTYDWPGNVRELENLVQRSLILMHGNTLRASDLAFESYDCPDVEIGTDRDLQAGLRNREYKIIIDALETHGGKRSAVADALGISPRTLRYKLARMREDGLAIPGERSTTSGELR